MTDEIEQEKEFKFLTNFSTLITLAHLNEFFGFKPTQRNQFQQTDFYYDTKGLFFYHKGLQFRVRQTDEDFYQAILKLPSGTKKEVYERTEHSTRLSITSKFFEAPVFDRSVISPGLETKLTSLVQHEDFYFTLKIVNARQVIILDNGLHLFLDNVTFHSPKHQTIHNQYEVEIEKNTASVKDFNTLAHHLKNQYGLFPSPDPKYQMGLSRFLRE